MAEEREIDFPKPPDRPLDSDCCGGGCVPCVLDIYEEEMNLWREECDRLRRGEQPDDSDLEEELRLRTDNYTRFPIISITQESSDALRFRFRLPKKQTLGLSLGQHIIVRCYDENNCPITRQYTPISPLDSKGYFEVIIKIYRDGRMSQLVQRLQVGDTLEARGPSGSLLYARNQYRRVLMLCAGTGVAPMCQAISSILADEEEETLVRLVYASRCYSYLLARSELEEWRRFWNFSCLYLLSQEPDPPFCQYKYWETVSRGRVGKDVVEEELGPISGRDRTLVLVCGTRSFNSDICSYLQDLGVCEKNIKVF